jgi:hypothetical protein
MDRRARRRDRPALPIFKMTSRTWTNPRGWGFREAPRPDIIHNVTINVRDRVKDCSYQVAGSRIGTLFDDTKYVVNRSG